MWLATGLFGEGCTRRRGRGGLGRGTFAAIEPVDQDCPQAPEKRLARKAADTADLATLVDQHEHRREALPLDEAEIGRNGLCDIDTMQRRAPALAGLVIGSRDLAIEFLAPHAAFLLEHHELGGMGGRKEQDEK